MQSPISIKSSFYLFIYLFFCQLSHANMQVDLIYLDLKKISSYRPVSLFRFSCQEYLTNRKKKKKLLLLALYVYFCTHHMQAYISFVTQICFLLNFHLHISSGWKLKMIVNSSVVIFDINFETFFIFNE